MTRTPRLAPVLVAVSLTGLVAACSGGGDDTATTTVPTTVAATTTTAAPTTLSPTTTIAPALAPLTGLPVADEALLARPALVVKIDNHPEARPQIGLNQADVVYEELVEGISRFAAVFHSQDATPVGPIRSARTSDIDIMAALGRPLFAWSGGNAGTVRAVRSANLVDVGEGVAAVKGGYTRNRRAPNISREHTLFADTRALFTLAQADQGPAPALFTYRADGQQVPAAISAPVKGVQIRFDGTAAVFEWDGSVGGWKRSEGPSLNRVTPHVDDQNVQIAPKNVVIQFTRYVSSPADPRSPEAQTVGEGEAWVFTDGRLIQGRWDRPDRSRPARLIDSEGEVIALTPGQTWVALPKAGNATVIPNPAA